MKFPFHCPPGYRQIVTLDTVVFNPALPLETLELSAPVGYIMATVRWKKITRVFCSVWNRWDIFSINWTPCPQLCRLSSRESERIGVKLMLVLTESCQKSYTALNFVTRASILTPVLFWELQQWAYEPHNRTTEQRKNCWHGQHTTMHNGEKARR